MGVKKMGKYKILIACGLAMLCAGCSTKENALELKKDAIAEYRTDFNACSLVVSVNGEKVESSNLKSGVIRLGSKKVTCSTVDTSTLGKKKVYFNYSGQMYETEVDVEDTTTPEITILETSEITKKNTELSPLDYVKATDISGIASLKIDGEFDLNKTGDYNLTAIAEDNNGNVSTKDFVFSVVVQKKAEIETEAEEE